MEIVFAPFPQFARAGFAGLSRGALQGRLPLRIWNMEWTPRSPPCFGRKLSSSWRSTRFLRQPIRHLFWQILANVLAHPEIWERCFRSLSDPKTNRGLRKRSVVEHVVVVGKWIPSLTSCLSPDLFCSRWKSCHQRLADHRNRVLRSRRNCMSPGLQPPENRHCELKGPLPFAKLRHPSKDPKTVPSSSLLLTKPPSRPAARSLRHRLPKETGPHRRTPQISEQA